MRRLFLIMSICWAGVGVGGCDGTYRRPPLRDESVGHWVNRYPRNPNLLGVQVRQFPELRAEASRYEGRHPYRVTYVFKDGRVNQVTYEPDGRGRAGGDIWYRLPPGDPLWTSLDPPPQ
ncbi:MAG: hypothetical protein NTV86_06385 [Planctomycetota bacterium]|nr:hypothetical protein [Planctomycetota bacterium]